MTKLVFVVFAICAVIVAVCDGRPSHKAHHHSHVRSHGHSHAQFDLEEDTCTCAFCSPTSCALDSCTFNAGFLANAILRANPPTSSYSSGQAVNQQLNQVKGISSAAGNERICNSPVGVDTAINTTINNGHPVEYDAFCHAVCRPPSNCNAATSAIRTCVSKTLNNDALTTLWVHHLSLGEDPSTLLQQAISQYCNRDRLGIDRIDAFQKLLTVKVQRVLSFSLAAGATMDLESIIPKVVGGAMLHLSSKYVDQDSNPFHLKKEKEFKEAKEEALRDLIDVLVYLTRQLVPTQAGVDKKVLAAGAVGGPRR